MRNSQTRPRLAELTGALRNAQIDLYLVPMVDAFQSEYIPESAARLPFLTGFTGSAGLGAFWAAPHGTQRHTLFVDGRYTIQAAQEVDTDSIVVLNSGDVPLVRWLKEHAISGQRIGIDPWLVTAEQLARWKEATASLDLQWVVTGGNLVDRIWADRPAEPAEPVALHPLTHAGRSYEEKRVPILKLMEEKQLDSLILAQPDGINWLLNIRGGDIPFNPLLLSYLVLKRDGSAVLYAQPRSYSAEFQRYCDEQRITLADIGDVFTGTLSPSILGERVALDGGVTSHGWLALIEQAGAHITLLEDPTTLPKACKHAVEMDGIRAAHRRDGLALTRFLCWLDGQTGGGRFPHELDIVAKLESFRAAAAEYRGPSFATIAGSGPNGAIVHYRADEKSNRRLNPGELLLLDSGGQYPDGTTDVTRTVAIGKPSALMREHFTRVLKGHIALASAQFPEGTSGIQLDVLARSPLWEAGLDFDHGTGHGVGAYLCVHEGPQRISKRGSLTPLMPGMVVSNEPGYYAAGAYGIRIESLVTVVPMGEMLTGKTRLGFETLTLVPIDLRLVDIALLSATERNWLNQYHQLVFKTHAEAMGDDASLAWLTQATQAI